MFVDEFGPFRKGQEWFGIKSVPVSIAGKAVMLAGVEGGDARFGPCQFPIEIVQRLVTWFDNPLAAEALVPPTQVGHFTRAGKRVIDKEVPMAGFRTMDRVFLTRDGKVMSYDPAAA
jgi:hypothetical protein